MNQNWNAAGQPNIVTTQIPTVTSAPAVVDRSDDDEFGRFEDLTRKLMQVPKSEIDEKRKG